MKGDVRMTVLEAKERKEFRHSFLTKIRADGNVPAIVYGTKMESKPIFFNEADFIKTIREVGRNGVFSVDIDGKKVDVVLTEYQADPLKNTVVHADLLSVDKSTQITAEVTVNTVGDSPGVKEGGVLQQALHEITVTGTPGNIPQSIDVDISKLEINDVVTIEDLKGASSYEIEHDAEETILSILPPRVEEEPQEEEVVEEPEVIDEKE